MNIDPEFLEAPLAPAGDAQKRFIDELDWHLAETEALHAEIAKAKAETERRLEEQAAMLRQRYQAELEAAADAQRAALEAALRRSVSADIEARLREDYLARLKASQEAREKAAEQERAYMKDKFDRDLAEAAAEATRRAEREAHEHARRNVEGRLEHAVADLRKRLQAERDADAVRHAQALRELAEARDALLREKDAALAELSGQLEAARSAAEAALKAAAEEKARVLAAAREEADKRLSSALAQAQAAYEKELSVLRVRHEQEAEARGKQAQADAARQAEAEAREREELKKTLEKQFALIVTQKDLEVAQARRALEAEQEQAMLELRKRVQEEAQEELSKRTERMKSEWEKLRLRFDEELVKIRAEMKKREDVWEGKLKTAEAEAAAQSVAMRAKLMNIEDAAARLDREKQALVEENGALRLERDKTATELAALKTSGDLSLKKLSEDKAAAEAKLADAKKDFEGKLKAVDGQLREERKKNVELSERLKELLSRGLWGRIKGA